MAALLRQGARRIGSSLLQRTQAAVTSPAVAEERRRLVPRRMYSSTQEQAEAMQIQKQKEELYEALSKAENWWNKSLLQDLAAHVKPRLYDDQWRWLRASRRASNFVTTTGTAAIVSFAVTLAVVHERYGEAIKRAATLQKNVEQ